MRDMRVDEIGLDTAEDTTKKMKFSIKDFFSRCDQIRSFLRIWSHLLKKSLMENFIFCAVGPQTRTGFAEGLDNNKPLV